jgi:acyl-CoA synthetase (AMP-forming)/AMP-acid ligase II
MSLGLRPHDPESAARYRASGLWTDETVGMFVADRLARDAATTVTVFHHTDTGSRNQPDVLDAARRIAGGLCARGVKAGDVVAFQLPNSVEAAATFYGLALLGAVAVPIVPFYGRNELQSILGESNAKVLIAGAAFGDARPRPNFDDVRAAATRVELLVSGDGAAGTARWSDLLQADPIAAPAACDPARPALLAYTSGTTKPVPKGVIHTHQTLMAEVRQLAAVQPDEPQQIIGAPVGHAIGMLGALLVPIALGRSVYLADGWNPRRILREMLDRGIPAGTGSPYFLTSLLDHADFTPEHLALIKYVGLGGAPVPAEVVDRCAALGISLARLYGLTEHPSVAGASHDEPAHRRTVTDGRLLEGVEVRVVDDDGNDVPPGTRGELLTRGPDRCAGFVDPALSAEHLDAAGWLHTGDVGVLTDDGWLSIVDRKKDLIIKGGENISPGEIEGHLSRHGDFLEVAVVGTPDLAVGERVCAYVRLAPGRDVPELAALHKYLRTSGLAPQKWPDEVVAVEDFPRTPSGKVKKVALREQHGSESVTR